MSALIVNHKLLLTRTFRVHTQWARSASDLKTKLSKKIEEEREKVSKFVKEHGKNKVCDITVSTVYRGMRGGKLLVWEPSLLDPEKGIRFRGLSIPEVFEKLPKAKGGEVPLPEGMFYLLMTGEVPNEEQVKQISTEWACTSDVPEHVKKMVKHFPRTLHPMVQFGCAVAALGENSKFTKAYNSGVKKKHYWETTFDDAMSLLAKLPGIAALVYNHTFKSVEGIPKANPEKDWARNFVNMMELPERTKAHHEVMRLYLSIHSDHEGGNVSAHATYLVNSALSDPFLSYSAGLAGLAGPLHGLANQECLTWLMKLSKAVGKDPSDLQVCEFIQKTLKSGQVVPGFGHAVLRKTDPRYTAFAEFSKKHLPDDHLVKLTAQVYKIAPDVLKATGKVQNPWPNVDGHSGAVLQAYGWKEMTYYTVLFGVARALGVMSGITWARALGLSIERPKSLTSKYIMKHYGKKQ